MTDKDKKPEGNTLTPKTGTLSVGTLSARGGNAAGSSRSAAAVVEVRRRRFGESARPAEGQLDGELEQRLKVLKEAEKNAQVESERREAERRLAEELAQQRVDESERKKREEEERKKREEERLAQEIAKEAVAAKAVVPEEKPKAELHARREMPESRFAREAAPAPARDSSGGANDRSRVNKNRDIAEKRGGRNAYLEDLEARYRAPGRRASKHRGMQQNKTQEKVLREVIIPEAITVQELANRMSERAADLVKKLMQMGQMATMNEILDQETAALLCSEFGHTYKFVSDADVEEGIMGIEDEGAELQGRPPVVTVMGHVDHGKTTLLDTIRKTAVAAKEAGGITQHIGAYQVRTKSGRRITFLDTPGHAAFTSMRARGAAVTDVVILVVAADDGVMPQTVEAIKHAKAAGVPIVVAVNKCDKPEADPQRVRNELLKYELVGEEFGGDTIFVNVSAKHGQGIEDLEEMVLLQAEVLDLKANPNRKADGVVVESQLDKGRGSVATVIVQRGTLKDGDILVVGSVWGRVRALVNDQGKRIHEATPAMPVEIVGLQGVPEAGDTFVVVDSEKKAREIAEYRDKKKRDAEQAARSGKNTLEALLAGAVDGERRELAVVVKGDVQGSVEAIGDSLMKLSTEKVSVKVLHSAVGVITESDVMLANASKALIIGFNVRAGTQARDLAEREGIEIRYYNIIYNMIDDIKAAMSGLLAPKIEEKVLGSAQVREVFRVSKVGTIAGCMVTEGMMRRNAKARLLRDGIILHDGSLGGLKRFKDDAKEVQAGYECGLSFVNFNDIRENDVVECYELIETAMNIDDVRASEEKRAKEAKEAAKA